MAKKRIYVNYNDFLKEELKNSKFAMIYLNEALQDENPTVFLIALKDVIEARGNNISALSKKTKISRPNIYKMLSKKGNPRWHNITSLIEAMGLQVNLSYK